jgi:hypothetical protein
MRFGFDGGRAGNTCISFVFLTQGGGTLLSRSALCQGYYSGGSWNRLSRMRKNNFGILFAPTGRLSRQLLTPFSSSQTPHNRHRRRKASCAHSRDSARDRPARQVRLVRVVRSVSLRPLPQTVSKLFLTPFLSLEGSGPPHAAKMGPVTFSYAAPLIQLVSVPLGALDLLTPRRRPKSLDALLHRGQLNTRRS